MANGNQFGFLPGTTNTTITATTGNATVNDVDPIHGKPGKVYSAYDANGVYCEFVYVQFIDAVTYAKGQMVCLADDWTSGPFYQVTNDTSEILGDKLGVAGVVLGVQTQNYYGFVQVRGPGIVLNNNDDDAAIGDGLIITAADGHVANVETNGTSGVLTHIGIATSAVNTTTNLCSAFINIQNKWWLE